MCFSSSSKKLAYISSIDDRIKQEHLHLIDDNFTDSEIKSYCKFLYDKK